MLMAGALAAIGCYSVVAQSPRPQANRGAAPLTQPPTSPDGVVELDAMVVPIQTVPVPAQVEGVLTQMPVEEGSIVEEGQTLALIDDRQAQLTLKLKLAEEKEAKLNSENDINLRDAENSLRLETEKAKAFTKLAEDGGMAFWEAETQRLEATRQVLRLELARLNQDIASSQYEAKSFERQMAQMEIEKRKILAPISGFVEKREAQKGEWVQPGSPILQLVGMDRLRAQGFFKSDDPNQTLRRGMRAEVVFSAGSAEIKVIPGVVGFVGNDVDLAQQRRIWVEFDNERIGEQLEDWLYQPGMKPTIRIYPRG